MTIVRALDGVSIASGSDRVSPQFGRTAAKIMWNDTESPLTYDELLEFD
jgi:hypothetical protein